MLTTAEIKPFFKVNLTETRKLYNLK